MRHCSMCGNDKPEDAFGTRKSRKGVVRLLTQCRDCLIQKSRNYYANNRECVLAKQKEYLASHQEERVAYRRRYREDNRERLSEKDKVYRETSSEAVALRYKAYYLTNRDAIRARQSIYRTENREILNTKQRGRSNMIYRKSYLQRLYGISESEYASMLTDQGGVCAICGKFETSTYRGKLRELAVDHCHESGVVRGLLCNQCNAALGKFKDSPDILRKALDYLLRHDHLKQFVS